ncbi:MAG: molybdate ABC transporter permease subunit [Coriobacteriales bacterium]|jgi:molybdate transport system permease protein|nr:molybdate ABC transporter permease subunit [Coriobacteriales bacterium]
MSALIVALCLLCAPSAFAAQSVPNNAAENDAATIAESAAEKVEVSADGKAARVDGVAFGISDFERLNKGTNKTYEGSYYGYRYPVPSEDAFVLLAAKAPDGTYYDVLFLTDDALRNADLDPNSDADKTALIQMIRALDQRVANGGTPLADLRSTQHWFHGNADKPQRADLESYTYSCPVEVEPGRYYATVTQAGSEDGSGGALFCVTGHLVPATEVAITQEPTGLAALQEFFTGIDYRPFWVSLRTSVVALVFVFVLGLLAAFFSLRINPRLQGILDSIFTIPMVLPPTVCGFILLVLFGNSTELGRWLIAHGIELVFSWPAAVLAAIVVAFPLMYRTARGAFEGLDPALLDAARTLGWRESRIFVKLMLPLAWPSIAAGTVLAFARAMGEFGATLFVAGNYAGETQTMPIAIYFQWMGGHSDVATFWVFVVILISFVVIVLINWYASHTQRYRKGSSDELDGGEQQ